MTALLATALTCLISTAPLLIAVTAAVLSRDPRRRAHARHVVRLLRYRPAVGHGTEVLVIGSFNDSGSEAAVFKSGTPKPPVAAPRASTSPKTT